MKKETFLQFITRRTGFGKTPWISFVVIQVMLAAVVYGAIASGLVWLGIGWWCIVNAILLYATIRNYNGKQG